MRVRTTCNRDCPDACGIVATVEDGRVVRLEGDPDHPVTRGFLCYRTNRFLDRQYDPDRLTTPLVRRGEGFAPIGWDEALAYAAERLLAVRAESGGAAILSYRSGGSLGLLKHLTDHFFARFGPTAVKAGDICSGAGDAAQLVDFGEEDSHDLFDLRHSRTIVLWGKNPLVSNLHLVPLLKEARARGARLVLVDPVHHRSAALCDLVLQPRPGGDVALALGVARWLFEHGRADPRTAEWCDHLGEFRAACFARPLAAWAALADVPPAELVALAAAYADGPAAILVGWGLQRRGQGAAAVRVLDALGAISGNLGVPGGGVSFYFKRRGAFDLSFLTDNAPRRIPEATLGAGILAASDPPVRIVWVSCANPVAMLPDSATVARALATRELTVVVDAFLTDTARAAHLVLPTTTMLEDDDLVGAYGHHWLGEVRPVVPPPPGVKSDYQIIQALAARVGLGAEFAVEVGVWKERLLAKVADRGASLAALGRGAVRNPLAPTVLFAERRVSTPSGRVNLIAAPDPEPPRPTAERPLLLLAISEREAQCSQTGAAAQREPLVVVVHPDAAGGLGDGALARLESANGELVVRVRLDPRQRRDVALTAKGGWLCAGRAANALLPARETDAGGGAVYYDTPVRLLPLG